MIFWNRSRREQDGKRIRARDRMPYVMIAALGVVFAVTMTRSMLSQNVESRALTELQSTASMQATAFAEHVEEQFQVLHLAANLLKNGEDFACEEMLPALESMTETFRLCMLGFADPDGNVVDYRGNPFGNIKDRAYFQEIVNGTTTQYCQFLATTKAINEPRVMFSIPAYDAKGELLGVLFCSKEISVLEDSFFAHTDLFDSSVEIFICDDAGDMIAANESAHDAFSNAASGDSEESGCFDVYAWGSELRELNTGETAAERIRLGGDGCFAARVPVRINDWSVYCVMGEKSAAAAFHDEQLRFGKYAVVITLVFVLALAYSTAAMRLYVRQKNREAQTLSRYYDNYRMILQEMNGAVVQLNLVGEGSLTSMQPGSDHLELEYLNGSLETYQRYKKHHPELDFAELEREMHITRESGRPHSFESFYHQDGKLYWLKILMIPIFDGEGHMDRILFAIFDASEEHRKIDAASETFDQIPGGVHRCHLSEPMHEEFISEGLCRMLGYSQEEVAVILGQENHYPQLLYPEDRSLYRAFVGKLAECGGTQVCEYRMQCKDGSLLTVSDAMYATKSSSGTMYGYSVVTDLRQYKEMQRRLEQELEAARQQLRESRIRNAYSQLQPHFLYNTLATIREIVVDKPEHASDRLYDFSTYLRACICSLSGDSPVPFSQEIEGIRAYVNLERMRFGGRIRMEYDCPETDFFILPLGIQPLVENAIRHGIYERRDGGVVTLRTTRTIDGYLVCVEDDGVGFDFPAWMSENSGKARCSSGLSNLIFRFETLMKAKVTVESRIGSGTRITIQIPFTY